VHSAEAASCSAMAILAGVEGGGTTFVVCLAEFRGSDTPVRIIERAEFPTELPPSSTINKCVEWLKVREYEALGVAMFGPLDLNPDSPTWGYITTTPKPGWRNVDIMGPLLAVRRVPHGFDTDVNAPALEEFRHFAQPGETSAAYITVGTGIGVGVVINGKPVRGLVHPEGGHIPVLKRRAGDQYAGASTLHPWCVEAQCSAKALAERAGVTPDQLGDLPDDSEVWQDAAWMLGGLCATLTALLSIERIVLSGGVMQRMSLFPKIRRATREILDGYIQHPKVLGDGPQGIDGYIVPSVRGNDAGIFGALALASDAYKAEQDDGREARLRRSSVSGSSLVGAAVGAALAVVALTVIGRRRAL